MSPIRTTPPREFLRSLYDAAVARALPAQNTARYPARRRRKGRTLVLGAGKAGGAMAAAVDALWPQDAPLSGLVVTRYHHVPPAYKARPGRIEVVEAAHPVPDAAGQRAAQRILELTAGPDRRRPGAVPDLRRRLGAAVAAGAGPDAGGQARHQQGAAEQRRGHRRDELRAQAPVGHQGRAAGRALRAGAGGDAADQRRARRRARGHRQRPDRGRPDHLRRCAAHPAALRHRDPAGGARRPGQRRLRNAQARRCALRRACRCT